MLFWPCCCGEGATDGGTCCDVDYLGNPFGNLTWPSGWASEVCGGTRTYGDLLLAFPPAADPMGCDLCNFMAAGVVISQTGACIWGGSFSAPCNFFTYLIDATLTITKVTGPPTRRRMFGSVIFTDPFGIQTWTFDHTADSLDLATGEAFAVSLGGGSRFTCDGLLAPASGTLIAV